MQQSIVSPRSWWRSSNSVEHFDSGIAHTKATGFYKNEMKKKENTKYVHRILFIEAFVVCWTMNKYLRIQRSACQIVTFLFTIAIHCICCVMHWMPTFCFIVTSVCSEWNKMREEKANQPVNQSTKGWNFAIKISRFVNRMWCVNHRRAETKPKHWLQSTMGTKMLSFRSMRKKWGQ